MQKVGVLFSGYVLAVFEVVPLKLAGNATACNLKFSASNKRACEISCTRDSEDTRREDTRVFELQFSSQTLLTIFLFN